MMVNGNTIFANKKSASANQFLISYTQILKL